MQNDEQQEVAEEVVEETQVEDTQEETQQEEVQAEETKEDDPDYRGKLNAQNNFLKKEGYEFKEGKWVKPTTTAKPADGAIKPQMSLGDATAIIKADVHEDDISRVEKFAADEGITIREALKNDELRAILSTRSEKRTTAKGANVGTVRRGATVVSDQALIDAASNGKIPDDDAGIARLIAAKSKKQ